MHWDILWAFRWLSRNRALSAGIIAILALGIGANTAVFSIVDAVLLRPLPYEASARLVRVDESAKKRLISGVPAQDYFRWRERTDLFDKTVPFLKDIVTLTGAGDPDQVVGARTEGGLFALLGVGARLGRTLLESDNTPDAAPVVVISDKLWRRRFNGDPGVVGRIISLSEEPFTVAGVMPPEFEFPSSEVELWAPLRLNSASTVWFQVLARLKPEISIAQTRSAFEVIAGQLEREDPKARAGLRFDVSAWTETTDRQYELTLILVLVAVGLVLLIACANVGSLLLTRAVQRQREIAIRASLGAGFWRVVRQLLAESLVLVTLASASGIALAYFTIKFLSQQLSALPIVIPHLQRVSLNGRVLVFNIGLGLILAVICGLAPVLMAARTDIQGVLRGVRGSSGGRGSSRLFAVLIASEAAFAFLLLVGSGLVIRSLINLQQADHGFKPDHVLTLRVPVGVRTLLRPSVKYDTKPRQIAYYNEILERVQRLPGLQAAAVVNNLPLSGVNATIPLLGSDGRPMLVSTRTISPLYFSAMGIRLVSGRTFSDSDEKGSPGVAIVNEYLAKQLYPDRNAVGEFLPGEDGKPGGQIVGVVKDTAQMTYDKPPKGELYIPIKQFIFAAFMTTIVVRTSGEPTALASTLQKEVWAVDPNQPVVKVATMNDVIATSIWRPRFSAWIFSVLGALALLLTSVGVYGIVAYTSSLRAQELGIRVALGATPQNVVMEVVRGALVPFSIGLGVSILGAIGLSRLLTSILYEIGGTDPVTYLSAAGMLLAIGIIASARPAWKAAMEDPLTALRAE